MATNKIPEYDPNYVAPPAPGLARRIGNNLSQDFTELRRSFRSPEAAQESLEAALAPAVGNPWGIAAQAGTIGQGLRGAAGLPVAKQAAFAARAAAPGGSAAAGAAVPAALMARNEALADGGAPTDASASDVIINPNVGQLSARGALRRPIEAIVNPTPNMVPTQRRTSDKEAAKTPAEQVAPQAALPADVRAAQVRGNQGAIIRNPDAASLTDRIAMATSAFKGSPSMRKAIAEALIGQEQGQDAAYQASLNRDAQAGQFNAQQQNAVATANADRGLRGRAANAELMLKDAERRDTQAYRGSSLALEARKQLLAERAALGSLTGATGLNKRYDDLATAFMERNPGASYEQAADFAANAARLQGVNANNTLIGRGSTAMEGERISELAGAAGRGVNADRSPFSPLSLYDGRARATVENAIAGLSNGQTRSITQDAANFTPRKQNLREYLTSLAPGGMSPGDVVWEDAAAKNAFSAPADSLRGMTLEQWRNRYGAPRN